MIRLAQGLAAQAPWQCSRCSGHGPWRVLRLLLKPASRGFSSPVDARAYLRTMARGMARGMCIDLWRRREVEQAWLDTLAA